MDQYRAWKKSRRKNHLRLLAAGLSFCLLLTACPDMLKMIPVFAAGEEEDADIMIQPFSAAEPHSHDMSVACGTDAPLDYIPLTGDAAGKLYIDGKEAVTDGEGIYVLPGGNYYLAENITEITNGEIVTQDDAEVNLCLNGKTLHSSVCIGKNGTFRIGDCQEGGIITYESCVVDSYPNAKYIMYGGCVEMTESDDTEAISITNTDASGEIYGGTIRTNGECCVSGYNILEDEANVLLLSGNPKFEGGSYDVDMMTTLQLKDLDTNRSEKIKILCNAVPPVGEPVEVFNIESLDNRDYSAALAPWSKGCYFTFEDGQYYLNRAGIISQPTQETVSVTPTPGEGAEYQWYSAVVTDVTENRNIQNMSQMGLTTTVLELQAGDTVSFKLSETVDSSVALMDMNTQEYIVMQSLGEGRYSGTVESDGMFIPANMSATGMDDMFLVIEDGSGQVVQITLGDAVSGQTTNTLTQAAAGMYLCKVTWEGMGYSINSDPVELAEAKIFAGGDGTQENPYIISNLAAFELFRDSVNGGETYRGEYIKLTADIDLSSKYGADKGDGGKGISWTPIGRDEPNSSDKFFSGTFDGSGHNITGLYIKPTDTDDDSYLGLFGCSNGTIRNLCVSGTVNSENGSYIGGVLGANRGMVENCCYSGEVNGNQYVGGIVGVSNAGTVQNCYNTASVTGNTNIGGIVGALNGQVMYCYNTGKVTGSSNTGGVVGTKTDASATISKCFYLDTCNGSNTALNADGTSKTADEFRSGEVAYLLQGAGSDQCWGQSVKGSTADTLPVLTDETDKKVYKVTFNVDESEYAVKYANASGISALPEAPETDDAVFEQWKMDDGTVFTANTTLTADVTVHAVFSTDAEKVEKVKQVVQEALEGITATNETTKESIQRVIDTALSNAGIAGVTVTVGDLTKTEATAASKGSITGTIAIQYGNVSDSVDMIKTIARLNGGAGTIVEEVETDQKAPATQLSMTETALVDAVLTEGEKQSVLNGTDIKILLIVEDVTDSVNSQDKTAVQNTLDKYTVGQYLDISLVKIVGTSRNIVSETAGKIKITITIPENLKNTDVTKTREFAIIRIHNGEVTVLNDMDASGDTITIETDRFSTYALVYQDTTKNSGASEENNNGGSEGNNNAGSEGNNNAGNEGNNNAGNSGNYVPKTGDTTPVELYAVLTMIAGCVCVLLYFGNRKRCAAIRQNKA